MTVNLITYGTSQALIAPSSFTLNVINPCSSTTVTGTSVLAISLIVWDPEAVYPVSGAAFADFTDSISTLNNMPNMCAKTYSASISPNSDGYSLTNFIFDPVLR